MLQEYKPINNNGRINLKRHMYTYADSEHEMMAKHFYENHKKTL